MKVSVDKHDVTTMLSVCVLCAGYIVVVYTNVYDKLPDVCMNLRYHRYVAQGVI